MYGYNIANSLYICKCHSMKKIIFMMGTGGSGKTTNFNYLLDQYRADLVYVPSYTTRSMREWEIDGQRYHFVSDELFQRMIDSDELLEYASAPGVHRGKYYGTKKSEIDEVCSRGQVPIKEMEVEWLQKILQTFRDEYDIISIFLTISNEEIRRRVAIRQSDMHWEDLEERIIHTQREREFANQYCTHVVDASPALEIVQARLTVIMDQILS